MGHPAIVAGVKKRVEPLTGPVYIVTTKAVTFV
jgi:hypothetical protein